MVRYSGLGTRADLDNHANQLNPNNWRYWKVRQPQAYQSDGDLSDPCCCRSLAKLFLGILAFIFLACAITAWFICGYVVVALSNHAKLFLSGHQFTFVLLGLVAMGAIFLLTTILTCCGIRKTNPSCFVFCGLGMIYLVLLVLLIGEIIVVMEHKDQIQSAVRNTTLTALNKYTGDNESDWDSAINIVQQELHCCGENNYTDWLFTPWAINQSQPNLVPWSCCDKKGGCGGDIDIITHQDWVYQMGCCDNLFHFVHSIRFYITLAVVGMFILIVLGIVATCKLA